MPVVDVYNMNKEKVGEIELPDDIFAVPIREHLFYEVVKWQLAKRRAGTACTKNRAMVSGSTRKLYRQKGTGRARRGDIKSPILRGGGVAHGPKPRDYSYTLPKRVRREALKCALSKRLADNSLIVIDKLELPAIKTKYVVEFLKKFNLGKTLFVDTDNRQIYLASRNIPGVSYVPVEGLNVYDILRHDTLVVAQDAIKGIEGRLRV